jgi:glutaminyl-peptide cyclotransferase
MKRLCLLLAGLLLASCDHQPAELGYQVVSTRPHDTTCYTQGLEFHGQKLFESGGMYESSTLRETDPTTGMPVRRRELANKIFAEGITIFRNELWMLTWKEKTVNVYEPDTFKFLRSYHYEGEGWGLTHDDQHLIMSDGSSTLKFIDPSNFQTVRTLKVQDGDRPIEMLNELEMVNGQIFANIYMTDRIARISPEKGNVTGWLDLSALRKSLPPTGNPDVLNGIALMPGSGNLLVTGKYWPQMFEIRLTEKK